MELLVPNEILFIAKQCGFCKVVSWSLNELQDKIVGYLGDHLNLTIEVEANGIRSVLTLFVKCMPRFDKYKADYLRECLFFKKEYTMLSDLFAKFGNAEGVHKWRPKVLFIKEDIFVFENVTLQGYKMPNHLETLTFDQLEASVATLARFHAQSYIFEERKSKELGRTYRIWEQYSHYLREPSKGTEWRDAGRNAVIDFLKIFSKYKSKSNFSKYLKAIVPKLFDRAVELMKPSLEYRNVVVHRDLWTNNIFLKKESDAVYHAMFVDFQTVIYTSPMLDLSSLIYFNTSQANRRIWTEKLLYFYHDILTNELEAGGFNIKHIFDKSSIKKAYEDSIIFGITQACIITPIIAMSSDKREEIFCNPESCQRVNEVSRSKEFIEIAEEDARYRERVIDLFDEVVERFVFPEVNVVNSKIFNLYTNSYVKRTPDSEVKASETTGTNAKMMVMTNGYVKH